MLQILNPNKQHTSNFDAMEQKPFEKRASLKSQKSKENYFKRISFIIVFMFGCLMIAQSFPALLQRSSTGNELDTVSIGGIILIALVIYLLLGNSKRKKQISKLEDRCLNIEISLNKLLDGAEKEDFNRGIQNPKERFNEYLKENQ
jgi:hypothetical protein